MQFKLRPILSDIKEFYQQPISKDRFKSYLHLLMGDTASDMALPIAGFNPMAKEHVLQKIEELEKINAETIMEEAILEVNAQIDNTGDEIQVVLNIADNLKGAWTNFYTTDFDSKFKLNAFVSRNFCVPYFWTSENYTTELIETRTKSYLYRTVYRKEIARVKTLKDHLNQEIFVAKSIGAILNPAIENEFAELDLYYKNHNQSEDYALIFNFFYGDEACASLGFKEFGISDMSGFEYAKCRANVTIH